MTLTIKQIRFLVHAFFWLSYFVIVCYTFSTVFNVELVLIRTGIVGSAHFLMVYIHLLVLTPKLLKRKKYTAYVVATLLLLFATVPLKLWLVFYVFEGFFNEYSSYDLPLIWNNLIGSAALMIISAGFWYAEQGILNLRAKEQLARVKLESEIQLLRQQMNPHFLFNTLNNIYSLSYTQSPKAPESILKLSNMLRYMLYECHEEFVPIENEVAYLQDYIELQQLKTGQTDNIIFKVEGHKLIGRIPPMLLVPFFENAFKHGNTNPKTGGSFKAELQLEEGCLRFNCQNPIRQKTGSKNEVGGIGLNNVQRRLELLYPNKFELNFGEQKGLFKAELKIDLT